MSALIPILASALLILGVYIASRVSVRSLRRDIMEIVREWLK